MNTNYVLLPRCLPLPALAYHVQMSPVPNKPGVNVMCYSLLVICRKLVMERARLCLLAWGNNQHQNAIASRFGLFDVIIGADVVYAPEALHSLFRSCSAMLRTALHARLVLCYIVRRVTEDSITAVAAAFGLTLEDRQQETVDAADRAMVGSPFRLLVFCKQ